MSFSFYVHCLTLAVAAVALVADVMTHYRAR